MSVTYMSGFILLSEKPGTIFGVTIINAIWKRSPFKLNANK